MQEVESSNRNMVDNMHEIENVMKDITDCIGNADESTKIMLSKYEESASNVDKIENVVGAMMESLELAALWVFRISSRVCIVP